MICMERVWETPPLSHEVMRGPLGSLNSWWRVAVFARDRQSAFLMYGPNISEQLKTERFSTAYKGMDSGAKGWCQILSCTWCISRDLAGSLAKTERVFVHIQHPLRDSLLKLLLRLCLAPEVFHRKIQHILGDVLGRDSGGFDPRKCSR